MVGVRATMVTELRDYEALAELRYEVRSTAQNCRVNSKQSPVQVITKSRIVLGESAAVSWTLIAVL